MIKAVFLDIDNTLLSFYGYVKETMRTGFEKYGLRPYEDWMFPVFKRINNGLWRQIELGEITFQELSDVRWNRIFAELGIDFDGHVFEKYFRSQLRLSAIPIPGAAELVDYLSGKYLLCAASNGPYEQQVNRLRIWGRLDRFAHVFVSSDVGAQKPEPAFFDGAFKVLRESDLPDLKPEETIIIGDSLTSDIAGGAGYGMKTCLYQATPAPLGEAKPDYVVRDLLEIKDIL